MAKEVQLQMGSLVVNQKQMGCQGSRQVRCTQQAADQALGKSQKSDKRPFHSIFESLIKSIVIKQSFYKKYQRMCLSHISLEQSSQITLLLKSWGQNSIKENFKYMEAQNHRYYKELDILSARVYGKFIELIDKFKRGQLKYEKTNQNQKVMQFLNGLTFSYNRYFFMKNEEKADDARRQSSPSRESQRAKLKSSQIQSLSLNSQDIPAQVNNLLTESSIHILTKMYHFMVSIELISLTESRQISNVFILNLERIKRKEQKLLYCKSIQFNVLQQLLKAEQKEVPLSKMDFLQEQMPNYFFYKTKINSDLIPKKSLWNRYQQLIKNPNKNIQLLFPNHFQSQNNAKSSPLSYIQKRLFLIDEEVGLYLLMSTCVYLDAIGISLNLEDFRFQVNDESRIAKAFIDNETNYSIFMRILASLSITGFREIAVRLLHFLNLCYSKKILPIGQKGLDYLKMYSTSAEVKQMCFLEEENFPKAHLIFNKIKIVQPMEDIQEQICQQYFSIPQPESEPIQGYKKQDHKNGGKINNTTQLSNSIKKESPRLTNSPNSFTNQTGQRANSRKLEIDSQLPKKLQLMAENINLNEDTINNIHRNIVRGFTQCQKHSIFYLLKMWGSANLNDSNIDQLIRQQYHYCYIKCDLLSARVYARAMQLIARLQDHKDKDQQNRELLTEIRNKKIDFSFDRFFFEKKYSSDKDEKSKFAKYLIKLINESTIQHLRKLFGFMEKIMLISMEKTGNVGNKFMQRLQKLSDTQRKSMYFESIQFRQLQNIIDINNENGSSSKKENMILQTLKISCPNYYFYRVEIIQGKKKLHNLYGSYNSLEERHDYIQWMFPNHYQSAFNSQALPMNYLEKRFFLDEEMGLKMLVSIYIFFDFLGVRLDLNTFELSMCDESRFRSAIVVHTHNHLRLMRILACLSIVGFRYIALKLIAFLDRNTRKGTIGEKYRYEFEKNWEIYGDERDGTPKAKAKAMCFLEEEGFPQEHCILKLAKQIGHIDQQRLKGSGSLQFGNANRHSSNQPNLYQKNNTRNGTQRK